MGCTMFEDKVGRVVVVQIGERFKYEGVVTAVTGEWIHIIDAKTKLPASFNLKEVTGVREL